MSGRSRGSRRSARCAARPTSSGVPSAARSARHRAAMASSRSVRVASVSRRTRHGRVWCGAGAVTAARTASSTISSGTGAVSKARTVRRAAMPSVTAVAPPQRNRSSSAGRTRSWPVPSPATPAPRTRTKGAPSALPRTRSAAPASSSATAATVTSSGRPSRSVPPRSSRSTATPAAPSATSVWPRRQGRPKVSVTSTPTSTPGAFPHGVPDRGGGGVGVLGQQQGLPAAARWRRRCRRWRPRGPAATG